MFVSRGRPATYLLKKWTVQKAVASCQQSRNIAWTSNEIRSTFIEFFAKDKGHTVVKSSSVIPEKEDRGLLLVNAGMNQFKPIFLDTLPKDHEFENLRRAVNSQKCIRVGGKHNDLENVGRNFRHHTFFEMLGNWSFGDYYKKEACAWAWELLTKVYKLDTSRLVVTYFAGDERYGLGPDEETKDTWLSLGVAEVRIVPLGARDNFWEMGGTGPCGPCTEIHYIIKPEASDAQSETTTAAAAAAAGQDMLNRSIEIWNLVFIQFNKDPGGSLASLPKKHVDTGMGLERIVSVIQTANKNSNYDSDLFLPLFACIAGTTGARPYGGSLTDPLDMSYRIIADHSRMFTVAIADGLTPGKQDASHKLRKVLRAASWETINRFKARSSKKLLSGLSNVVAETLSDAYPEVQEKLPIVQSVLEQEIDTFERLLKSTQKRFKAKAKTLVSQGVNTMSGKEAYEFFQAFGAPKELLHSLGEKYGLKVDLDEFEAIHANEKKRSVEMGGNVASRTLSA